MTGASLAYFDGRLTEVAIKVALEARERGIPVLVEGERLRDNLDVLLALGDHVCTSAGYPRDATGEEDTETAMVAMLAGLPRAKTLVTTLGSRGAVMVARVDDWEEACETTTLRELAASLEAEAKAKKKSKRNRRRDGRRRRGGSPARGSGDVRDGVPLGRRRGCGHEARSRARDVRARSGHARGAGGRHHRRG